MSSTCSSVRQSLIGTLPDSAAVHEAHLAQCAACTLWWRRQQLWIQTLSRRLEVPAELDARVGLVDDPASRRERALAAVQGLEELRAPAELEALVRQELGTPVTHALGLLETRRAPHVLDRLVAEELADPAAASVRRHAGALERLDAPAVLERAAEQLVATRRRPGGSRSAALRRHPVLASSALAAAALLAWVASPASPFEPRRTSDRTWSFEVVRATPTSGLDAFGLGLVNGLAGGAASPMHQGGQE